MNPTMEPANDAATPAYVGGRDAGRLLLSPSLNPFPEGSAEHDYWRRGRDDEVRKHLTEAMGRARVDSFRPTWSDRADHDTTAWGSPMRPGR
jgi:hypothetical protein